MHSGCVANCQAIMAMLQKDTTPKGGDDWAEQALGTPMFSSILVETMHFKKPPSSPIFTSVEIVLVAPSGVKQTHYGAKWRVHSLLLKLSSKIFGFAPLAQCIPMPVAFSCDTVKWISLPINTGTWWSCLLVTDTDRKRLQLVEGYNPTKPEWKKSAVQSTDIPPLRGKIFSWSP